MADHAELKRDPWKRMSSSPFVMMGLTGSTDHSVSSTVQLDEDSFDALWLFIGCDRVFSAQTTNSICCSV